MKNDSEGIPVGVVGSVDLLQNVSISTQPISGFDWNADKVADTFCCRLLLLLSDVVSVRRDCVSAQHSINVSEL